MPAMKHLFTTKGAAHRICAWQRHAVHQRLADLLWRRACLCNRVDSTHPDTLAQTFYLRPVTLGFGARSKSGALTNSDKFDSRFRTHEG